MPTNRRKTPRKQRRPRQRHGAPPAPERASSSERGKPFPKGNNLGLPTRFAPGKSGNPGGVPKDVAEYRALMRARVGVMLERLDDLLEHGTEDGLKFAIREVNTNAFPRPVQSIELAGPDGGAIPVKAVLTSEEKRARAAELIAAAAARAAAKKSGAGG